MIIILILIRLSLMRSILPNLLKLFDIFLFIFKKWPSNEKNRLFIENSLNSDDFKPKLFVRHLSMPI